MNSCICIAFKYNDVFYTVNTEEFKACNKRILIIFKTPNLDANLFPFKNLFDYIYTCPYRPNAVGIFKAIMYVNKLKLNNDLIFTSNIKLLIVKFFINKINNVKVILLEDGTMNYQMSNIISDSGLKGIVLRFLGIRSREIEKKIIFTYLLSPVLAKYFFGVKKKLCLDEGSLYVKDLNELLNGKSIFIGGNYYKYNMISIKDYNVLVNKVISDFNIDFYMPHQGAVSGENILCEYLDISSQGVTIEMILPFVSNCTIYSFGSSILFSAEVINKNIVTVLIKVGLKSFNSITHFFEKIVTKSIQY